MIQEKVEKGELITDRKTGGVRVARERRQESLGTVPSVGALASKLRAESGSQQEFGLGVMI
jgi:hypothetical protein